MPKKQSRKAIDPLLQRQLDTSGAATGHVEASFTLRTPRGKPYLNAEEAAGVVRDVVRRAADASKKKPAVVNVFPHVQSFVVSAPAELVRKIIDQPEIASATANQQQEDMLIRPVRRSAARVKQAVVAKRQAKRAGKR